MKRIFLILFGLFVLLLVVAGLTAWLSDNVRLLMGLSVAIGFVLGSIATLSFLWLTRKSKRASAELLTRARTLGRKQPADKPEPPPHSAGEAE